jgi:hypothetical protein
VGEGYASAGDSSHVTAWPSYEIHFLGKGDHDATVRLPLVQSLSLEQPHNDRIASPAVWLFLERVPCLCASTKLRFDPRGSHSDTSLALIKHSTSSQAQDHLQINVGTTVLGTNCCKVLLRLNGILALLLPYLLREAVSCAFLHLSP